MKLLRLGVIFERLYLADNDVLNVASHIIYVLNLSCGEGELVDESFYIASVKVNIVLDPVY